MMLDRMKDLGFKFSSKAGITVGVADIVVLPDKQQILDEHEKLVDRITKQFNRGLITEEEGSIMQLLKFGQMQKIKFKVN